MSGNYSDSLAVFKQHLLADKKKTVVLTVLFVVLLIVVGRLFTSKSTPATAGASATEAVAAVAHTPAPDQTMPLVRPTLEAKSLVSPMVPAPGAAAPAPFSRTHVSGSASASSAGPVAVADLPRVLERDLFSTTAWSKFPSARRFETAVGGGDGSDSSAAPSEGVWRQLTTVLGQYQENRQGELERLEEDLAALQLQSTVTGPAPMAYISGRLVREGDLIRGFTVIHIQERRVVVRKLGLTRELCMP